MPFIDRDELVVAKILYPSMVDNTIVLRSPKSPFDQLPNLRPKENILKLPSDSAWRGEDSGFQVNSHSKQTVHAIEKTWKIAYIDHNVADHQNLTNSLKPSLFSVITIKEAMDAFSQLIEFQPNIIFIRAEMPELSGYELCRLLRNHNDFHHVPIIMVSKTAEQINDAKSKRMGATGCLAKPLKREVLLDTVWQYLQ